MSEPMYLCITLRKEVPDRETAELIYELVKTRFVDRTDIDINGCVTNHFAPRPADPPP